ncbi:CRISPR system precrRNA processing endoribonuclease RAMP protein Cas6 [Candidatus Poribacteria bacterium]|nr:CRISPR system precrRNA processing endoribonuclease RAMP protein Cas6 [Candidatus Poribacteria bacterium]
MLADLEIAKFAFHLQAEESGYLPSYKGSTLRGGFGYIFRSVVCSNNKSDCKECKSRKDCAYSYIFETSPTDIDEKFSGYSDIPRPFVIESDENRNRYFEVGNRLQFDLILIGKAIDYLPYFIFSFDELGSKGLGRDRTSFILQEVCGFDFEKKQWEPIYYPEEKFLKAELPTVKAGQLAFESQNKLKLQFITPTRIKYRGKYICDLEFHVMMRNLLRRISLMMIFHGGIEPDFDFNDLITKAKEIDVSQWDLGWQDWNRYSTRQKTRMKLGGFTGDVEYMGDISNFITFIALGELIHIGKNATFGLGKYKVM